MGLPLPRPQLTPRRVAIALLCMAGVVVIAVASPDAHWGAYAALGVTAFVALFAGKASVGKGQASVTIETDNDGGVHVDAKVE